MQSYTFKVISITRGVSAQATRPSSSIRDGWGTPRNRPQLLDQPDQQQWTESDDSPHAA